MSTALLFVSALTLSALVSGITYTFIHYTQYDRTVEEVVDALFVTFTGTLFALVVQCLVFHSLMAEVPASYPTYTAWIDVWPLLLFWCLSGYTFHRYIRCYGWRAFLLKLSSHQHATHTTRQAPVDVSVRPAAVFLVSGWIPWCLYALCTQEAVSAIVAAILSIAYWCLICVFAYFHQSTFHSTALSTYKE